MKKPASLVLACLIASHSHAAFDDDSAVVVVKDAAGADFYFFDLLLDGQEIVDGANAAVTSSGLAAFLAAHPGSEWALIAGVNDIGRVGGPPAAGEVPSYQNNGLVSSSSSSQLANAVETGQQLGEKKTIWFNMLDDIQLEAGGSREFALINEVFTAQYPSTIDQLVLQSTFTSVGSSLTPLWYVQYENAFNSTTDEPVLNSAVGSFSVGLDGTIAISQVPVPATAWLFISGIIGLTSFKRLGLKY